MTTTSRDAVLAAVRAAFAEDSWPRILKSLDGYGVQSCERERDRVQLAIVKLSEGNEEKLIEFIAVAKQDYRDILFWADHPEESKIDTPEKKKMVIDLCKKLGVEPPPGLADGGN